MVRSKAGLRFLVGALGVGAVLGCGGQSHNEGGAPATAGASQGGSAAGQGGNVAGQSGNVAGQAAGQAGGSGGAAPETGGSSSAGASGSAGSAGSAHGGAGGSAGSAAGNAGAGGAGTAGTSAGSMGGASTLTGACVGPFGNPEPQYLAASGKLPSNLSLTGDALELFSTINNDVVEHRRASTSVAFGPEQVVTEFANLCAPQDLNGLDVTNDGLRIYISCSDNTFLGALHMATRPDRNASFVIAPTTLGTVGASISISTDELTLYAVTTPTDKGQPLMYQRASVSAAFGAGKPVPGLAVPFRYPEISADDLSLFGATPLASGGALAVATRKAPGLPFDLPTAQGFPAASATVAQLGPTVSADCGLLVYLRFSSGQQPVSATVDVLRR